MSLFQELIAEKDTTVEVKELDGQTPAGADTIKTLENGPKMTFSGLFDGDAKIADRSEVKESEPVRKCSECGLPPKSQAGDGEWCPWID